MNVNDILKISVEGSETVINLGLALRISSWTWVYIHGILSGPVGFDELWNPSYVLMILD